MSLGMVAVTPAAVLRKVAGRPRPPSVAVADVDRTAGAATAAAAAEAAAALLLVLLCALRSTAAFASAALGRGGCERAGTQTAVQFDSTILWHNIDQEQP
jgi:hypothetical protein